jgi:hypothetical protein
VVCRTVVAIAARIHVRASSSRVAFSLSVLDWMAEFMAWSAYCRNRLVSDMTGFPAPPVPLTMEPARVWHPWKSDQDRSLPLRRTKNLKSAGP